MNIPVKIKPRARLLIEASARQRRLSAMHEAGHAVIGRTLGVKVQSAEIFLRSGVYNWGGLIKYDHIPTARQQRLCIAGAVGEWCWGEFVAGKPSDPAEYLCGAPDVDFGLDLGPDLNPNLSLIALDMSIDDRSGGERLDQGGKARSQDSLSNYLRMRV